MRLRRHDRVAHDGSHDDRRRLPGLERVDETTVFEPDALVRCGPSLADDALVVVDPVIVVEVASPSTQQVDALLKLTRSFRNASIMDCLIVMPDERRVLHLGGRERIYLDGDPP